MAVTPQRSTIVGVFEDRRQADQAVAELKQAGFGDEQMGLAMRHHDGTGETSTTGQSDTEMGEGAVAGMLTGLGLGALAGLGVLSGVIPVIGPAIAGGTLGIILSNAAAGAAVAGVAGALIGYGIPEDEAHYYGQEFEAGRAVVTVRADGRADEAMAILRRHGGYDRSSRESVAMASTSATTTPRVSRAATTTAASGSDTLKLKEERLHAEKHPVQTGEVRIGKEVHTETRHIEVPVEREEVVIERRPVHGGTTSEAGEIRAGEEIRVPVREEQVSVHKEAVVTEEVGVGKRVVQDTKRVGGEVRKEQVKVERRGDVDIKDAGPR